MTNTIDTERPTNEDVAAAKELGHAEFLEWMAKSYATHPRQPPTGTLEDALARLDALYEKHGLKGWRETLGWQDAIHDWGGLPV
jgi:hypothetical protein